MVYQIYRYKLRSTLDRSSRKIESVKELSEIFKVAEVFDTNVIYK